MPTKEETAELEALSLEVFGNKYEWQKLRRKGLVSQSRQVGRGIVSRRMPLTVEGAKHYMKTTLEMRKKIQEEANANRPASTSKGNEG